MNFQFYYEKLCASDKHKKFLEKHPESYMCSGFFVLDKERGGNGNKVHFDFWDKKSNKMHSFSVVGEVELVPVENFEVRDFEPVATNLAFEVEDFEKIIIERMSKEKISNSIQKILFSFQRLNGKDFLLGTVFLNNLGLIKLTIDLERQEITGFEKKSFFDMLKIVKKKN